MFKTWLVNFVALVMTSSAFAQVQLTQIVSRENAAFDSRGAVMTVGRDGRVYLSNQQSPGFVLRFGRDGSDKVGGAVVYAMGNATANAAGVIATANAHFAHAVNLYDANFKALATNAEFLVSDAVGWDAPLGVEAGETSGDFYGIDHHRNRVVRIDAQGRTVTTYPIFADEKETKRYAGFRVCEKTQSFYWHIENHTISCSDLAGKTRWTYRHPDSLGSFDVDSDGKVWVIGPVHDKGVLLNPAGQPDGNFTLQFGDQKPASGMHLTSLRVFGEELLVKRFHPTELFQSFDRATGQRKAIVSIDHEQLTVRYPTHLWKAGEATPFAIEFNAGGRTIAPHWRVWAATWGDVDWRELSWRDGRIVVPVDMAGLYQLKVSPELRGAQSGSTAEFLVRDMIEVRVLDSVGTVSILTPGNRTHFAPGEKITAAVVVRAPVDRRPTKVTVLLSDGKSTLMKQETAINAEGRGEMTFAADSIAALKPGRYRLTAQVAGFTVAAQPLVIGTGLDAASDFRMTVHGDYGLTANYGNLWDGRDVLATHLARIDKRRVNQFVDRFGIAHFRGQFEWSHHNAPELPDLMKRLAADPIGVDSEKARILPPGLETQAAYGAAGVRQWSILTYMDAGLPLGSGHDPRSPKQFQADVKSITSLLKPFPSFRGWSWTSNWWIYEPNKIVAEAKWKSYEAALKVANESGKWNPILDEVGEARWNLPTDSRKVFKSAMDEVAPQLKQADSGPYRNVQVYPPVTYRDVDEVDVQFQAEQITVPNWHMHAVDFEKRPGKPTWFHPEIWNDQGTGEQILPMLFQIAMRGGDGVGSSGWVPNWGTQTFDNRSGYHGLASIMRAAGELFHEHGPWMLKTKKNDRVAIVVSPRLIKIDTWQDFGGLYFERLFEAYQSCLYAHRPASIVFLEDLDAVGLKRYQAVLVVGQTVEMEPKLAEALRVAKDAGVAVFADGSCRAELVTDYKPLGVSFNQIEKLHSINNDFAYWEHPRLLKEHAAELREKLAPIVFPVAECDNPEVTLTERLSTSNDGVRYVFAVNSTTTPIEPGSLWRMTLGIATRLPVKTMLGLRDLEGCSVYDLFDGRQVQPDTNGRIECDLRTLPMRVYAIVPGHAKPAVDATISARPSLKVATQFGPHLKDIAIAGDVAVLNAFNWDNNLYGLDINNGQIKWRDRVGHYFTFAPQSTGNGFAVQGYDFTSAQGYHLHLLNKEGKPSRRFALPGLPQRLPHEFISGALLLDRTNQFAVSSKADWVAAAGNLGMTAWDRDGKQLWAEDWSKSSAPAGVLLTTLNDETLASTRGMTVLAHDPRTGTVKWRLNLASSGEITRLVASADGNTLVALTTTESGRLFVIRNGRVINTIPASGDELSLSPDGSRLALTDVEKLKLYDSVGGLIWQFNGDDRVHHPRFAPDGKRIAFSSELGTASVLSLEGDVLFERDLHALTVPAWLPQGDLLLATWMGTVMRLDERYAEKWRTLLSPDPAIHDIRPTALQADPTPTSRYELWTNTQPPEHVAPAILLTPGKTVFLLVRSNGQQVEITDQPGKLFDGDRTAPVKPWINWRDVYPVGSGGTNFTLVIDRFNTNLRVNAVTIVEDPAHPESWLRDVMFESWNPGQETWEPAGRLLSDQAAHTHLLPKPVEAARFRLSLPRGFVGNLRLSEIMLHGEELGPSHPDAVANKPTAVLFDENEGDLTSLKYPNNGFSFRYEDAFSGGKCLAMDADKTANAYYRPPFGHLIPNWAFRIVEQPTKPGEYRWLSFAWKGYESSRGMTLRVGEHHAGGVSLHAGEATKIESVIVTQQVAATPPKEWTVVTIDLWKLAGREMTIGSMSLSTVGGAASFDRILLGRTEEGVAAKKD